MRPKCEGKSNRTNENINNAPAEINPINTFYHLNVDEMFASCPPSAPQHFTFHGIFHTVYSTDLIFDRIMLLFFLSVSSGVNLVFSLTQTIFCCVCLFFFYFDRIKLSQQKICVVNFRIYYSSQAMVLIEELFNVMEKKMKMWWNDYGQSNAWNSILFGLEQVTFFPGASN